MMFNLGNAFVRTVIVRSKFNLCKNYHLSTQIMQGVSRNTSMSYVKPTRVNNIFMFSPLCMEHLMNPLPGVREPAEKISRVLDMPTLPLCVPLHIDILDPPPTVGIEEPNNNICEKQAARLVVIRRRKMKKHKLRKLRKKMKFVWAKVRQRRELKKEKLFQAKLVAQINGAEKFDAAEFVSEKLSKAYDVSLTNEDSGTRPKFSPNRK